MKIMFGTMEKAVDLLLKPQEEEIVLYSYENPNIRVKKKIEIKSLYKLATVLNWFVNNVDKKRNIATKISDDITAILELPKCIWLKDEPQNLFAYIPMNEIETLRLQINTYVSCYPLLALYMPVPGTLLSTNEQDSDLNNTDSLSSSENINNIEHKSETKTTDTPVIDNGPQPKKIDYEKLTDVLNMLVTVDTEGLTEDHLQQFKGVIKETGLDIGSLSLQSLKNVIQSHIPYIKQEFLNKTREVNPDDYVDMLSSDSKVTSELVKLAQGTDNKGQMLRYLIAAYLLKSIRDLVNISMTLGV